MLTQSTIVKSLKGRLNLKAINIPKSAMPELFFLKEWQNDFWLKCCGEQTVEEDRSGKAPLFLVEFDDLGAF